MSAPKTPAAPEGIDKRHPGRHVKMSSTGWAYSLGSGSWARGVYRKYDSTWRLVAPLPYVRELVVRRDARDAVLTSVYRLSMSPEGDDGVTLVGVHDLQTGVWADRLQVALSGDRTVIAAAESAIREVGEEAPRSEISARVADDQLQLPPIDVVPPGYLRRAEVEEAAARETWRKLLAAAQYAPKVAFTIAAVIGGLYVRPLNRQSFFVSLTGGPNLGKTTALMCSAAVVGDPREVKQSWQTTVNGELQDLATYGLLPAFRDELSTAPLKVRRDLDNLIMSVCEGGQKKIGSIDQIARRSARWGGIWVMTTNHSVLGQATEEGVSRRVVEVETPITVDRASADAMTSLSLEAYGWPLHWLQRDGMKLQHMRELCAKAECELDMPDKGLGVGLGMNHAVVIAGAERLEALVGVTGFRTAVARAARELYRWQMRELEEDGLTAGQRALSAVAGRVASRMAAYPTREQYNAAARGDMNAFVPPVVEGWDLDGDQCPGDLAVRTEMFAEICEAADVDYRVALRELDKRSDKDPAGSLLRVGDNETDKRRVYKLRLHGKLRPSVYVLRLPADSADPVASGETTGPADASQNAPAADDTAVQQSLGLAEGDVTPDQDAADPVPEEVVPESDEPGEDAMTPQHRNTATPSLEQFTDDALIALVNDPAADDATIDAALAELAARPAEVPAPAPVPAPERPAEPPAPAAAPRTPACGQRRAAARTTAPRRRLAACGVLDTAGLWLPGRDVPIEVAVPADAAAAYRLAIANEVKALWFHPSVHAALGIPAEREVTADFGPATALEHPWTSVDGYRLDTGDGAGLAAWVNIAPEGEGRRLGLVFPAYDASRSAWHTAPDGRTLCAAVVTFAESLGEPFYMSLNETSAAMIRKSAGDKLQVFTSSSRRTGALGEVPEPMGKVRHLGDWSRALLDEEEGGAFLDRFDLNAAEASVNTSVFVGIGVPERGPMTSWNRAEMKKSAGYVLANVPRQHPKLDTRLPSLLGPWSRVDEVEETRGGPAWAPVELFVLLDEIGVPFEPVEALMFPDAARLLRPYGEHLSKGRMDLMDAAADDPASDLALDVAKAMYKSRQGDYNRRGSRIFRPDVRDGSICKSRANAYRRLRKIGKESGRYPVAFHVDAAYYVSHDDRWTGEDRHDNAAAIAPAGMTIGTAMGEWKHETSVRLVRVADMLGQRSFPAKFDKLIDEKGAY
ncbi:MAG TPA: DUF927 domain-containing protein [Amycolatopsis sp.]|nr:DUF927 domain-containing protein [Amycolatopsis sp.]